VPFGSPLLALIDQVRSSGSPVMSTRWIWARADRRDRQVDLHGRAAYRAARQYRRDAAGTHIADKMDRQLTHRSAARSVIALAAMLAHEIKNPLSGIRGAAQLLEQAASSEDRMLTRLICDEADRIVTLVDRMEVSATTGRWRAVRQHSFGARSRQAAGAIGLCRNVRSSRLRSLAAAGAGNQDQLIQVFLNLVKERRRGRGRSRYRRGEFNHHRIPSGRPAVGAGEENRGCRCRLSFCVKDNARRAEDLLPNLFDPFVTTSRPQRVGLRAGGQDRRRPRGASSNASPNRGRPRSVYCCHVQQHQALRPEQSRARFGDTVACLTGPKMRNNNACR